MRSVPSPSECIAVSAEPVGIPETLPGVPDPGAEAFGGAGPSQGGRAPGAGSPGPAVAAAAGGAGRSPSGDLRCAARLGCGPERSGPARLRHAAGRCRPPVAPKPAGAAGALVACWKGKRAALAMPGGPGPGLGSRATPKGAARDEPHGAVAGRRASAAPCSLPSITTYYNDVPADCSLLLCFRHLPRRHPHGPEGQAV